MFTFFTPSLPLERGVRVSEKQQQLTSPYFSIILPTYNRAHMLPRAIQSVIEQSFRDFELIIMDDGSTDNTAGVVNEINDSRIRYHFQENTERSIARNRGIDLASGKYICFLDSDDYYLPSHLESFYRSIKEKGEPIAFFYCRLFTETSEILALPEEIDYPYNTAIEYVVQNIIGPPQVCIHAGILRNYKFHPMLNMGEDLHLWMRILLNYPLIGVNDRNLIVCLHEGRTVNILQKNIYKYNLSSFRMAIRDRKIKKSISRKIRRTFITECYLGMGKYHLFHKNKAATVLMILISLYYRPMYQLKFKINIIYCVLFNFSVALKIAK